MPQIESQSEQTQQSDAPSATRRAAYAQDQDLVSRLIHGDGNAWQVFVQQFGRLIRARVADVARSFGSGHDANGIDDATAEVFAALLKNENAALRAFEGRSSLTTYLAVISTRCATRTYAAKRNLLASDQQQEFQELAHSEARQADPSHRVLADEQKLQIRQVLKDLPEKQRKIVELFYLQEQSYAEISNSLGIPMGSVGVTLKRAEAKLRELLEPD
ncbi:MAG: sigma-70 family RNA polymerase sigma factor [Planctomycetota bacterium]